MDRETFIALRNVLANMYSTEDESRRVARDAGLNTGIIGFNPRAVVNWDAILRVAQMGEQISDVIEIAIKDAPKNPLLNQIKNDGRIAPVSAPQFDKELSWHSDTPVSAFEKLMDKESTLLPISFLEIGLACSRSVARISLPDREVGTGFLVRDNILVTNHHVINDETRAREATIQFNYQNTATGLDREPVEFTLAPEKGFATSKADDWTLVRINGDANADWGKIELSPIDDYKKIRYVNIIQHPAGGPKQIALYHNVVAFADENIVQYFTDTLPGSSGSPVFDNRWRVVALHHSGGWIVEPETKKPVFRNEGININKIVQALSGFKP